MENRYKIVMDIKKGSLVSAKYKQGDTDTSILDIKLVDNGVVVDITGQAIKFNFLRADGTVVEQDSTNGVSIISATGGNFQCILKNSTLSVAGKAKCDIIFTKDGKELSTRTFDFTVEDKINSGLLNISAINAKLVEWQTEIDEIKEAYENATHENSLLEVGVEVVNARKGEVDLATKIGKIDSSLSEKANQSVVDIRDFGGMDDGTTDNRQPLLNAKIAAGTGGTILCPHTQGNNNSVYYFSSNTSIDTQDIRLDVADGTKISYPGNLQYGQPLNLERDTKFISTILGTERLYPKDQLKRHYIGESDIDKSTYSLPLTSNFVGKIITWQQPTVVTATPTVIDTNNIKIGVGVGSQISALLLPLDIGQQLIANGKSFTGGGSSTPNFGIVALTTSGKYYFAYVGTNTNGGISFGTTKSGAFVTPDAARPMFGAYLSYLGTNSLLSVERSGQNSFRAFANGVCITNGIVDMGDEISYLGFGAFNSGFTLTNFVIGNNIPFGGIEPLNFAVFGDSRTADVYHNWIYTFKDAIDGSQGIRIGSLTNYAVGGHTSVQQLTTMQSANLTDVDYIIIDLGTNDIQTSASVSTYIANITSMVNIATTAGARVILGIPFLFYSSSFTGINNHPGNYSGGALYRGALLQYASANGIKIVDTMRVVGMTTGDYDVVHDNIHPSFKTSELLGMAYAKAVLGDYLTIAK